MQNEDKNLSERLRSALKVLGVSQTELAKRINVKPQVIQYLCAGSSHSTKFMFDIAEALKIDVSWLATGKGTLPFPSDNNLTQNEKTIPVLSLNQIKDWIILCNEIDTSNAARIPIGSNISTNSFAVILNDQSMAPRFNLDTTVIIDPTVDMHQLNQNNKLVLVYLKTEDFIIFRQLNVINNIKTLTPVNSKLYKNIVLTDKDIILGICKEARWST